MGTRRGRERPGRLPLLHPSVLAVSIGLFGASVGFDGLAVRSSDQFIYAQGAFVLICMGLVVGVVGVVLLVGEVAQRVSDPVRRRGLVHLAVMDAMLAWFAVCFLIRRSSSLVPAQLWLSEVSGIVVLAAAVDHIWDLRQLDGRRPLSEVEVVEPP